MRVSGDKPRKGKPLSVDLHALRGITKSERLGKERTRCGHAVGLVGTLKTGEWTWS